MGSWTVPAKVIRVVDGDTLDVDLDLGWHITYRAKVRLAGLNCPELHTPEGVAAAEWVTGQLTAPHPDRMVITWRPVVVKSHSLDKYGRVLGTVYWADPTPGGTPPLALMHNLNDDLLATGHAAVMA